MNSYTENNTRAHATVLSAGVIAGDYTAVSLNVCGEAETVPAAVAVKGAACPADFNGDATVNSTTDVSGFINAWFEDPIAVVADAATRLMGEILYPRLQRALFGIDPPGEKPFEGETVSATFDLKPIRKAVTGLIESLRSD